MTDYAIAVGALYAYHETWSEVTYHLEQHGSKHPRAYWHGIAYGRIVHPDRQARVAIVKACQSIGLPVTTVTRNAEQRKNITVSSVLYERLNALKSKFGLTWNELAEIMLGKVEVLTAHESKEISVEELKQ